MDEQDLIDTIRQQDRIIEEYREELEQWRSAWGSMRAEMWAIAGPDDLIPLGAALAEIDARRPERELPPETTKGKVGCSQCGGECEGGPHGFSHCADHRNLTEKG